MKAIWELIEKIAHFFLSIFFKIIRKELTDEAFEAFMQFVRFGIVGLTNTAISYITDVVFLLLFRRIGMNPAYDYLVAQFIGFTVSVIWSFYWNNRLVFTKEEGEERIWWKAFIKTYISYSFTGIFLNSVLSWIWVTIFNISKFIAPLINLLVSVPLNFFINKYWAFKGEKH